MTFLQKGRADVALTIGQAESDVGGYNFKGVLDEFRIYKRELRQQEVLMLSRKRFQSTLIFVLRI